MISEKFTKDEIALLLEGGTIRRDHPHAAKDDLFSGIFEKFVEDAQGVPHHMTLHVDVRFEGSGKGYTEEIFDMNTADPVQIVR